MKREFSGKFWFYELGFVGFLKKRFELKLIENIWRREKWEFQRENRENLFLKREKNPNLVGWENLEAEERKISGKNERKMSRGLKLCKKNLKSRILS